MAGTIYTIFCLWGSTTPSESTGNGEKSSDNEGKSPEYEALTIFTGVALSTLICAW
jgi:hypothetical protein